MTGQGANWIGVAIGVGLLLVIVGLRARRITRPRKLTTGWLLFVPVLLLLLTASTLEQHPPKGIEWLWLMLSLGVGAALGWQRGRLMRIWIDPASGQAMAQGSIWAIVFLLALIGVRAALRAGLAYEGADAGLVGALFMAFALGLFGTQQAEMALRARRLRSEFASAVPADAHD